MCFIKCLAFFSVFLACPYAFADAYEIRVARPAKVGDRYELVGSGEITQRTVLDELNKAPIVKKNVVTATLNGVVTVLAVDALKRETKVLLSVSRFMKSSGGNSAETEVLPSGSEVIAELRDGREVFTMNGKMVSEDDDNMISLFIAFPNTPHTDDEILGTKGLKKVGNRWAINKAKAAEDFAIDDLKVQAKNISGDTQLKEVLVVNGTPCLHLVSKMSLRDVPPDLQEGIDILKSDVTADMAVQLPVDGTTRPLYYELRLSMEVVGTGVFDPGARNILLSVTSVRNRRAHYKPLP